MKENMDNVIPVSEVTFCDLCEHYSGGFKCKIYPDRLPSNIILRRNPCEKYKEKIGEDIQRKKAHWLEMDKLRKDDMRTLIILDWSKH